MLEGPSPTSCSKKGQWQDKTKLLRALSSLVLKTSKDDVDCTTSLGNVLQWMTALTVKKDFLIRGLYLSYLNWCSLFPILPPCTTPKILAPSSRTSSELLEGTVLSLHFPSPGWVSVSSHTECSGPCPSWCFYTELTLAYSCLSCSRGPKLSNYMHFEICSLLCRSISHLKKKKI